MKIVIFGATGFIGKKLFTALDTSGFNLTVLSRDVDRAREVLGEHAAFCQWDGKDEEVLSHIFKDVYAVINLAGENIAGKHWTEARKKRIITSRTHPASAIVHAINHAETKPHVYIQASAIGYYGSDYKKPFNEHSPPGKGFIPDLCKKWEEAAHNLDESVRFCLLRSGVVIGSGGGALEQFEKPFRFGLGGYIGSGKQWLSWIHIDDEVKAIQFLLENKEARGAYNLTAPEPVRMKQFARELGRVLKKPSWTHVPAFVIKLMLGQMGCEVVLASQKVLPKKLLEEGFKFQFSKIRMALVNIHHS